MGNISENKLGGLGLIIGPALATVLYILIFIVLGDGPVDDPRDFAAVAAQDITSLQSFLWMFPALSLIFFLFGVRVLGNDIRENGTNSALYGLGAMLIFFGTIGTFLGVSLGYTGTWNVTGVDQGTLRAAGLAINTYGGLVSGIGFLLVAIAISDNKEGLQKIFAYVGALAGFLSVVLSAMDLMDCGNWETTAMIYPIVYIIVSLWSISVGLTLFKK